MSTVETSFRWNTPGQVIAAAVVLPTLGIVAVLLRFRVRHVQKTGIGLDDWLILPAMLLVIGLGVSLLYGVAKHALAYPTPTNTSPSPESQLYQFSAVQELQEKVLWIFLTLLIPAYGLIKLSVIFFYRRIFVKGLSTRFDIITKVSVFLVLVWTFAFLFVDVFGCGTSISTNWGPLIDYIRCVNGIKWSFAFYITDFVSDLLIICLPLPIIVKLQMPISRKLAIIGILLLGAMSIAASITRMVFGGGTIKAGFAKTIDADETNTTLLYWSMLEAGLSLIATCLPILRPLFAKQSLQSVIATVRNVISLDTLRSRNSQTFKQCGAPYTEIRANPSRASSQATPALNQHQRPDGTIVTVPLADLHKVHMQSKIRNPDYTV